MGLFSRKKDALPNEGAQGTHGHAEEGRTPGAHGNGHAGTETAQETLQQSPAKAAAAGREGPESDPALPEDFGTQVETAKKKMPKVAIVKQYCTHAAGSDCTRCTLCCPHDAITLEDGKAPRVDNSLCTGCGICFGVCDAFASTHLTLADLHARLRRIAVSGRRAYLTCRENAFPGLNVDSNVVVLPCLSMVSPDMFTLLMCENIRLTIACDLSYCEDCTRGGQLGGALYPQAVKVAENRTGEKVLFTFRIPERQSLMGKYTDDTDPLGRRQAFTGLASDVAEIASGKRRLRNSTVLQDYYQKKERQRASALVNLADETVFDNFKPEGHVRRVLFPHKKMQLEAVQRRPDIAQKLPVALSVTDSALCTQAHDCVAACPTGARGIERKTGGLSFDARLCVGCGICVDACQQGACSVEETTAAVYVEQGQEAQEEAGSGK